MKDNIREIINLCRVMMWADIKGKDKFLSQMQEPARALLPHYERKFRENRTLLLVSAGFATVHLAENMLSGTAKWSFFFLVFFSAMTIYIAKGMQRNSNADDLSTLRELADMKFADADKYED